MQGTLFWSNTMLMVRYSLLLLLFHIASFSQLLPWVFLWGLLTWPWYFVQGLLVASEHKRRYVELGCQWTLQQAGNGAIPTLPAFLRKRFEIMHQEAAS